MFKKTVYALIALILIAALTACGKVSSSQASAPAGGESTAESEREAANDTRPVSDTEPVTESTADNTIPATRKEETTSVEPTTEQETETLHPELYTVEALPDDGRELSAAEALRSTLKGNHSALELTYGNGMSFINTDHDITPSELSEKLKPKPIDKYPRVNIREYNRTSLGVTSKNYEVWDAFSCVDMDGNGINEIILYQRGGDYSSPQAVLYYCDDEVFMWNTGYRDMDDIYKNGIFIIYDGVNAISYFKGYPVKGAFYAVNEAYEDTWADGKWYIHEENVSREEFDEYMSVILPDRTAFAEMYEFTDENIDLYIK